MSITSIDNKNMIKPLHIVVGFIMLVLIVVVFDQQRQIKHYKERYEEVVDEMMNTLPGARY